MYIDAADHRPRSLLDPSPLSQRQIAIGAMLAFGVHVVLPATVAIVVAILAAVGVNLGGEPPELPPMENVIQAHFLQLGEEIDPRQLPNRRVPILRTDTPEPAPNPHARPDTPPPERHEHQRDSTPDPLQRLSDEAQIFAEREERRVQEGDPNGIEGGETEATEGDRYAAQLATFFRRGWSAPTTLDLDLLHSLRATAVVHIGADLRIESFRITRPSGNADFDLTVSQQLETLIAAQASIPDPPAEVAYVYVGRDFNVQFSGRGAR